MDEVREIDGLNHYIGMKSLYEAAEFERSIAIPAVITMVVFLVIAALWHKRWTWILTIPAIGFPYIFLADLAFWMNHYGQNLDPYAPLSSAIKPFTPPVLGEGIIGQFSTIAHVDTWMVYGCRRRHSHPDWSSDSIGCISVETITGGIISCSVVSFRWTWVSIISLISLIIVNPVQAQNTLTVSANDLYTTIEAALNDASSGDIIEVHSGTYSAPLEVTKSVSLIGIGKPIIDGEGEGTTVIISANDVTFKGFIVRNTGTKNRREDSGIVIQADRVTVEDNILENVLYGIYFADAQDGVARNNTIRGYDLDPARRGDGMRVWFSSNVLLENNDVAITRDILIWFADDITIVGNTFHNARYGLHFMYSDQAHVENNRFTGNSVGTYLMYSTNLTLINNELSQNRGPSGYGIALKDMDNVVVKDNWLVGNRVGLYLDNSPALFEGTNQFSGNAFAYNDVGVTALPNVERNVFTGNSFLENTQQSGVRGRGTFTRQYLDAG